jgi:hemerythrin-like metal-binding protein
MMLPHRAESGAKRAFSASISCEVRHFVEAPGGLRWKATARASHQDGAASSIGTEALMTGYAALTKLSPLVWASAFETADPDIDSEHRQLLVDINRLSQLLAEGAAWMLVVRRTQKLRDRCLVHFAHEEEVLEGAKYDMLALHKKEHGIVKQQLDDILAHLAATEVPSRAELEAVLLLRSILVNHFFRYDISYRAHLAR